MTRSGGLYRAFGLDFQSALALPEMREGTGGRDVEVLLGPAPRPQGATEIERGVAAGPDDFWMEVPDVVRLHVARGARMTAEIAPGVSEGDVRAFLLGSGVGALLHQRGLLPLHASAVEIDGRAVLFTGASGAGKSTLALHLVERGHRLISDDISAIDASGARPQLWPGLINVKLWREALGSVGRVPEGLEQVLPSLDKYRLPLPVADDRPYDLAAIYVLSAEGNDAPRIDPLGGAAAATALVANTFRGQLVPSMDRIRAHFDQCVGVARATRIATLSRPWTLHRMNEVCDAVAIDTRAVR